MSYFKFGELPVDALEALTSDRHDSLITRSGLSFWTHVYINVLRGGVHFLACCGLFFLPFHFKNEKRKKKTSLRVLQSGRSWRSLDRMYTCVQKLKPDRTTRASIMNLVTAYHEHHERGKLINYEGLERALPPAPAEQGSQDPEPDFKAIATDFFTSGWRRRLRRTQKRGRRHARRKRKRASRSVWPRSACASRSARSRALIPTVDDQKRNRAAVYLNTNSKGA